ncbi:MAG TPA: CHASE domain-containing protein [Vicinamibacterales bacterium]|nr:CHASE domain-containing protein [Vicinamibacterales bacterium]
MTTRFRPHLATRLAELLVIAAAYYVVGRLGLLLAIHPGYATAVWPASGIALAGTLVFGYRVWPGTVLGSFFVNVWTSFDPSSAASILHSIVLATSIGLGASLQAILGAFLVRRFVGYPTPLAAEHDVIKFLALGGPVACLVNSTIGVTSLLVAGVIDGTDYLFHWWTWWAGDTIGVITFAPLVLIWADGSGRIALRRQIAVSVPLCIAFALVVTFFAFSSAWQRDRITLQFERRTDGLVQALRDDLEQYVELLHSIGSLYASSVDVDRQEFKTFVSRLLSRHPGAQALSWNPRVLDSERAAYEQGARRDGFGDFQITERNAHGQLVRAAQRADYVVVYYIEPHAGNEQALGFDVASDPTRSEALALSRDTGEPRATDPIILVQETQRRVGLLVFLPIYRHGRPHETVDDRRRNLQGYATGVFRIGDMIQAALKGGDAEGLDIRVYDAATSGRDRLLYDHRRPMAASAAPSVESEPSRNAAGLQRLIPFDIAGRQWLLQFALTHDFLATQRSWETWTVLAGGMLFTGLLGAFLLVVTGRTVQLQSINNELRREVAERKQAEEALRESERVRQGLLTHTERGRRNAEALAEVARLLSQSLDIARVGQTIADALGGLLSVEMAVIYKLEPDRDTLTLVAGTEASVQWNRTLRADEATVGLAIREGVVAMTPDVLSDPRINLTPAVRANMLASGYRAVVAAPLMVRDFSVGALAVGARLGRVFDDEEVQLVRDFASHAAAALENARLYHELREAYEQVSLTQDQLTQAQKLEAIGRLAGGVAHDFNNLLAIILGRGQIMLEALPSEHRQRRNVELIKQAAERAAQVTRQLLAFSRKQILQPKILDLNALVSSVLTLLRRLVREDIEFSFVPHASDAHVKADPAQLEIVLMNLTVNAGDAMPQGGRLTIETSIVQLEEGLRGRDLEIQAGRYVMLAVSDTGVGMDANTVRRIFEPFFTTKEMGKGTGLGLATVHGIVKQSGGAITLYSEPGVGTTFKVYLPYVSAEAVPVAPVAEAPRHGVGETVLVVEDEPELRELVEEILGARGYRVLGADSPLDALALVAHHEGPIDLLLTDVVMPKMSGRELAQRVQAVNPALRVLYMSGYTDEAIVQHGVLDPGLALIQKPFAPDDLARAVAAVLDRGPVA